MRKRTVLALTVLALACAVAWVPTAANATVLVPMDLKDLVTESSDIVLGRVVGMQASWNAEKSRIYTTVEIVVESGIKGDFETGEKIRFQTIGGTVDEMTLSVPGSPQFKLDEETVVFFGGEPNINTPVTGWEQGKFTVENGIVIENGRYVDDFIGEIQSLMKVSE